MKQKPHILVVEDEPIIALDIELTLKNLGYLVTQVVSNAVDAQKSIQNNPPDLVLLDIQIEGDVDGIMLAEELNEKYKIPFIYLTSNADKLTLNRVKKTRPAGFIVKPFTDKDLQSNIEIALYNMQADKIPNEIFLKDQNQFFKIKLNELKCIKAEGNYTLFCVDKNEFLISHSLKKVMNNITSKRFIRIHRSYIINMDFIEKIQDGYVFIGTKAYPIGKSYQKIFFKLLNKIQ